MTLRWVSALVTAAALCAFVTANVAVELASEHVVPTPVNLLLVAVCAGAAVVLAIAECYCRLDARVSVLTDYLVTRLDEIRGQLDDPDERTTAESRRGAVVALSGRRPRVVRTTAGDRPAVATAGRAPGERAPGDRAPLDGGTA